MKLARDWNAVEDLARRYKLAFDDGAKLDSFRMTGTIEGAKIGLGCSQVMMGRNAAMPMTGAQIDGEKNDANYSIVVWSKRDEDIAKLPLAVTTGDGAFDRRFVTNVGYEMISGDPYQRPDFGPEGAPSALIRNADVRRILVELDERLELCVGASRHMQLNHYSRGLVQLHFTGLAVNDVWFLERALTCTLAIARVTS